MESSTRMYAGECPPTLYENCVKCAAMNAYSKTVPLHSIRVLPPNVLLDIYYEVYFKGWTDILAEEFADLTVFERQLRRPGAKIKLHRMFQALVKCGMPVSSELSRQFTSHANDPHGNTLELLRLGFLLGDFLMEAGWFMESESIISVCKVLCEKLSQEYVSPRVECYDRLLQVQNSFCLFKEAEETFTIALEFVKTVDSCNLAALYSEFAFHYYVRSEYTEAYNWSIHALKELRDCLPVRVIVDVLRIAAKTSIVKRKFKDAQLLVTQAVLRAKNELGEEHPSYADALLDYGLYLLNADCVKHCVEVYKKALETRMKVFNGENLAIAQANEELAYAIYVCEYSNGDFDAAKKHADIATLIMNSVVPKNHLLRASGQRIKALILEEIAIDSDDQRLIKHLLFNALELHSEALVLCLNTFGKKNVQTAKHYGNLGRIYQSLTKVKMAEKMHLLAISIKEELLGEDDYEVALSMGHLASLYAYDMDEYEKAEKLYKRSIQIGRNLFGNGYSGLEYDYRGLIHVYQKTTNYAKSAEYMGYLEKWREIREDMSTKDVAASPLEFPQDSVRSVSFIRDQILDGCL